MSVYKPHINISQERIVNSVLKTDWQIFQSWKNHVQDIALDIAYELFIVYSNPFVDDKIVYNDVYNRLIDYQRSLSRDDYVFLNARIEHFWTEYEEIQDLREKISVRLKKSLSEESIGDSPHTLVQNATDATGLIMEVPLLVLFPENTKQVQEIVLQSREMGFTIVPRGGGTGLTGGAVPAQRNSVILSMSKLKSIFSVDAANMLLHAQAGVITSDAIQAARAHDLLFTIDPASKMASSLGGNISENAGGPYAFEYGTTLDNIYSYKMVNPDGQVVEVRRQNHPWHKIYPDQEAIFEILNEDGEIEDTIRLRDDEIRTQGLGKDVTNKRLGGLPGVQKEGIDGIITEASFTLHKKLDYSQTLCMEFYGKSMHNATLVIKDLVHLRNSIQKHSNLVTMSALEEFGSKYVRAIEYKKKSQTYEGEPISVLLIQLDSNNKRMLHDTVWTIVDIAEHYENVDVFVADDEEQSHEFWEDRHRLSAISRKTSGFKINEDIVIPLDKIPEFSDFLESMNLKYLAIAYKNALQKIRDLPGIETNDEFVEMELDITQRLLAGNILDHVNAEQDFALQAHYFFQDLFYRYPEQKHVLQKIEEELFSTRVEIANHMHAGDGNCHVNIPVHANNPEMLHQAEEAVDRVFKKVLSLGGQVSGEHGIGITKIGYLSEDKIDDLAEYRKQVDPHGIMNPEKLCSKELVVNPYTFSWDRLIQDFSSLDLPHKEQLSQQLKHIQICTRCGKCKQVCPMYYPQKGLLYHPRNKNISMGVILDALLYTQTVNDSRKPDEDLLNQLKELMDFCTACGKCNSICPVKIDSADVTINVRSYLESETSFGLDFKSRMLNYLGQEPERIQTMAKIATLGQNIQNKTIRFLPSFWRRRAENPMFQAPGPKLEYGQLHELLNTSSGNVFLPDEEKWDGRSTVIYFPGCGSALFYPSIGLSSMHELLYAGYAVVVPQDHQCCGYPLLSAGCSETFAQNRQRNTRQLKDLLDQAQDRGLEVQGLLTSCGTCRAALENYGLHKAVSPDLSTYDVFQFLAPFLQKDQRNSFQDDENIIFHSSCHHAFHGVDPAQSDLIYTHELQNIFNKDIDISKYCCAESGLGALTNPKVYNRLRKRKQSSLRSTISDSTNKTKILVSCPSCKIGISRSLNAMKSQGSSLHTMEYISRKYYGKNFKNLVINELTSRKKSLNNVLDSMSAV
ncbi:MAG: FAD-binding and (Fe-S)-binding domain-containing protein [Desulfohalobiaceae bacterium]